MSTDLHTRKPESHIPPNVSPSESTFEYMSCIRTLNLKMRCDHMNTQTQIHDATIKRHETRKNSAMYVTKQHDNVENAFIHNNDRRAMPSRPSIVSSFARIFAVAVSTACNAVCLKACKSGSMTAGDSTASSSFMACGRIFMACGRIYSVSPLRQYVCSRRVKGLSRGLPQCLPLNQ
jgi:hypothetical protein